LKRGGFTILAWVNKVKHELKRGAIVKVNNGTNTPFWEDVWMMGEIPLKLSYPQLYEYCRGKKSLVSDSDYFKDDLMRPLTPVEVGR
jgi:hypothetical protein